MTVLSRKERVERLGRLLVGLVMFSFIGLVQEMLPIAKPWQDIIQLTMWLFMLITSVLCFRDYPDLPKE